MIKEEVTFHYGEEIAYYKHSWWQLIRPMTLTGTIAPILVGTGFAKMTGAIYFEALIALLTACILIQVATNMLNDYYDFKHGQDPEKWTANKTSSNQMMHHQVLPVAIVILVIASIIGLWLASMTTYWVIPVGIIGILAGYRYSAGKHSFSAIGLGEVIGIIFLGITTTVLAYVVQGNTITIEIILLSIPFAALIASMILTNNIRDIKKDVPFRKTVAILIGRKKAVTLLLLLLLVAYLSVTFMIFIGILPWIAGFVYLGTPIAVKLLYVYRSDATQQEKMSGMKWVARHYWAFGLIFTIALWLV